MLTLSAIGSGFPLCHGRGWIVGLMEKEMFKIEEVEEFEIMLKNIWISEKKVKILVLTYLTLFVLQTSLFYYY